MFRQRLRKLTVKHTLSSLLLSMPPPPPFANDPHSVGLFHDPTSGDLNHFTVPVTIQGSTNDSPGSTQAGADVVGKNAIPEVRLGKIANAPENGNLAHWESSEQLDLSSPVPRLPNKRARVEKSRNAMSYPRKRAVTACRLCRTRKTKCSNTRPKCKLCDETGAACVYEDPLDHSS